MAQRSLVSRFMPLAAAALLSVVAWIARAEGPAPDQVEFFEKNIRPVLVEHCYQCHSTQSEKLKGGLLLDDRKAVRKGGESGPAVVPGDPDASLVLQALRYENFEMPPKGKLPAEVIANFEQWIKHGAADPREGSGSPAIAAAPEIDFQAARQFWSFRPPQPFDPPAVSRPGWLQRPVDSFILNRLD